MTDVDYEQLTKYRQYLYPILEFSDVITVKGKGCYIWDTNDSKILDLNSGQFCSIFGHSNDGVANVISENARKIQDTNTATLSEDVLIAAKKLHDICPEMNARSVFLSTGAEANECCLRYAKHLSGNKPGVVSFDAGYHGLTHGTEGYSMGRKHVKPSLDFSYVVPAPKMFYDSDLSDEEIDKYVWEFEDVVTGNHDRIAAAIFEPIVSSGGMFIPAKRYFKKIREICSKYGIYLIFDECQTGFGRTGTWFYYQQLECVPDFVVCAKGMGLGYPVSAVIFNGNTFSEDNCKMEHYSSHQNDPFAGAIVSYCIDTIIRDGLLERNRKMGTFLVNSLKSLTEKYSYIKDARGVGLMCAFDLAIDDDEKEEGALFCKRALDEKVMIQACNAGKTIRLLPSYCVDYEDIDFLCERLSVVIEKYYE